MTDRRSPSPSDEDLRAALAIRPDVGLLGDDLARIAATVRTTSQSRPTPARWLLLAATVALVLAALLAAVIASRPPIRRNGLVAVDVDYHIVLANGDGSNPHRLTDAADSEWEPIWSPNGQAFVYWSHDPLEPADACGYPCLGAPRRLMLADMRDPGAPRISLLTTISNHASSRPSWAPDSRRLVVGDVVNDVRVLVAIDTVTRERRQIGPSDLDGWDPTWSPDGSHIAFVRGHEDVTQRGLYLMDMGPGLDVIGSGYRKLTTIPSRGAGFAEPVWSPRGDRLAFAAETTTGSDPFQQDIWIVGLDGKPEVDISRNPAHEQSPAWSPDGTRLAWSRATAAGQNRYQAVVAAADGSDQRILTPEIGTVAGWSPDGSRVLEIRSAPSPAVPEVVAVDVLTGTATVIAEGKANGVGSWQRIGP